MVRLSFRGLGNPHEHKESFLSPLICLQLVLPARLLLPCWLRLPREPVPRAGMSVSRPGCDGAVLAALHLSGVPSSRSSALFGVMRPPEDTEAAPFSPVQQSGLRKALALSPCRVSSDFTSVFSRVRQTQRRFQDEGWLRVQFSQTAAS